MLKQMLLPAAILLTMASTGHAKDKWSCKKDGQDVAVKGKAPADKKKDCEAQSGTWAKEDGKDSGKEAGKEGVKKAPQENSGGGGSW